MRPVSSPGLDERAGRLRTSVVLFDLDGTLSDSAAGIIQSMRHAFAAHGLECPSEDVLRTFVGPPFARALGDLGFDAERTAEIVATYRADYQAGRLFDNVVFEGVPELLHRLRDAGVRVAVATSKPQPTARRIIEHFSLHVDLAEGLNSVFGSDPHRPGDTKADVIGRALRALEVTDPAGVIMVGDRLHDVEGAHEHGIACVGVAWGYAVGSELRDAGAVTVVETPRDLGDLLLGGSQG